MRQLTLLINYQASRSQLDRGNDIMKKILLVILVMLLSGCGVLDRGNYEKDRDGFLINHGFIIQYHTNQIGEIDVFMIDKLFTYFEALDYVDFDATQLSSKDVVQSFVSSEELSFCGIESTKSIPRFIQISDKHYYYHTRETGYCTYDEYEFHENGYSDETIYLVQEVSPIENKNVTRFKDADFTMNTFEDTLFVENIFFDLVDGIWVRELVSPIPMSFSQAGNSHEDLADTLDQFHILERYVLEKQSINLLKLADDYTDPDVRTIWSEDTIEALGRDHDIIKYVRIKIAGDVLDAIHDVLGGLGMFR